MRSAKQRRSFPNIELGATRSFDSPIDKLHPVVVDPQRLSFIRCLYALKMARGSFLPYPSTSWTCRACTIVSQPFLRQRPLYHALPHRTLSTSAEEDMDLSIVPAPEIDFEKSTDGKARGTPARIVPASPSYFTTTPNFNDRILALQKYIREYGSLPTVLPEQAPRMTWMNLAQFRSSTGEKVGSAKYSRVVQLLRRLNLVHPKLRPLSLQAFLEQFRRPGTADTILPQPSRIDEFGRSKGVGRRKSSVARVQLVEGTGQVVINGRALSQAFPRIHDRESALWPLKITNRIDKYNAFVLVNGGGLTGQAESVTLALAKALMVQEPALKPALRKGEDLVAPSTRGRKLANECSWLCDPNNETCRAEEDR